MGKDKLRKFAENLTFDNLVQPAFDEVFRTDHPLKGRWAEDFFRNDHPIVIELGCGRGEYTVGLGAAHPDRNFLGIDIKGARMWRGAKTATEMGMQGVGFLRTRIEFIGSFFGPGEVSEIWITFPDPQLKKGREKKRLTSPVFLEYYSRFLAPDGVIHLKTDSRELHDYTRRVIEANGLPCEAASTDIYGGSETGCGEVHEVGGVTEVGGPGIDETGFGKSGFGGSDTQREYCAGQGNMERVVNGPPKPLLRPADTHGSLADTDPSLAIKTTYERRFLAEGKPITYLRFGLGNRTDFEMVYDL